MFYSHEVFAKKKVLGRVWLAAHWDRKLTKSDVHSTDVTKSVETIMEPSAPFALRVSGHLMLGVVRIYSRKVKYLRNDCQEALTKINIAYRARGEGAHSDIDLPTGARKAANNRIMRAQGTEGFGDFMDYSSSEYDSDLASAKTDLFKGNLGAIDMPMGDGANREMLANIQDDDFWGDDFLDNQQIDLMQTDLPLSNMSVFPSEDSVGMVRGVTDKSGDAVLDSLNLSIGVGMDSVDHFVSGADDLNTTMGQFGEAPKRKRAGRRKGGKPVVVDSETMLSGAAMKRNLANSEDNRRECKMAPGTKRRMEIQENTMGGPVALLDGMFDAGVPDAFAGLFRKGMEAQNASSLMEPLPDVGQQEFGVYNEVNFSNDSNANMSSIPDLRDTMMSDLVDHFDPLPMDMSGDMMGEPEQGEGVVDAAGMQLKAALDLEMDSKGVDSVNFQEFFKDQSRSVVAQCFVSALTLLKNEMLTVEQAAPFGAILLGR